MSFGRLEVGFSRPCWLEKSSSASKTLKLKDTTALEKLLNTTALENLLKLKPGNDNKGFARFEITKSSADKGGHGGTLNITCKDNHDNVTAHLFLKPLNLNELSNYEYIKENRKQQNGVLDHMTYAYGSIKIGNQDYLVMDDARWNDKNQQMTTICDIKLAGKVSGINPIASLNETKHAGKRKGILDYLQMWLGAKTSPHFMVAKGPKALRLFHYRKSDKTVTESLKGANASQLTELKQQLKTIRKSIKNSNIAFIGASIIINKDGQGNLFAKLIDPAHIQVEAESSQISQENANVQATNKKGPFVGDETKYYKRKESNDLAMKKIIAVVDQRIKTLEGKQKK